tara:strand:+ start:2466 stop:3116 length:651 start_codon:yes stop_codon:yes gene_type:complete
VSKYHFTEQEKEEVKKAVQDLEMVTSGELVPYFVPSSDKYEEASWYSAAVVGLFTLVVIAFLSYTWALPVQLTPIDTAMIVIGFMLLGFLTPIILPFSIRWITSRDTMEQRVYQRAIEAFLEEGIYKTKDKIGILIFISKLEHKVVVIGDEGISAKVSREDWQVIVDTVVKGIKQKEIATGIVEAIGKCKDLLLSHGFNTRSDRPNELSDDLRIGF